MAHNLEYTSVGKAERALGRFCTILKKHHTLILLRLTTESTCYYYIYLLKEYRYTISHNLDPRRNMNLQWIFHNHGEFSFFRQINMPSFWNLPIKIPNQISHKVFQMEQS